MSDRAVIAESFNKFYINIGPNLAKQQPPCSESPVKYIKERNNSPIYLNPVEQYEVKNIIMALKISSPGWNEISPKIIKDSYEARITPLTYVLNLSITKGIFPKELKLAKVIPIHKGDRNNIISNYRPVSLLPVFSKILERLMYNRLLSFINKHKLLYDLQFGFRKKTFYLSSSHFPN